MCRILAVASATPFALRDHLVPFAGIARRSREFQGHGWGCAWWSGSGWSTHHAVTPIWEDPMTGPGTRARVLLAHARSAFRDEGIAVENNMPFLDGPLAFVFNGELRGVRIAETGRIGAEKLFRFLVRHGAAGGEVPARAAVRLVKQRTRFVRAMNFAIARPGAFLVSSLFSEDEEYYTLHARRGPSLSVVCSEPYDVGTAGGRGAWAPLENGAVEEIRWCS